jgi:diguanylate cyclase (GGDEF)-like protein/PAS domain S-box-containing protein
LSTEQQPQETTTQPLREVLDAAAIGLFLIDATGRIELINRAAELHSTHREAVEGMTVLSGEWTAIDVDGNPIANEDLPAEVTRRTGRALDDVEIGFSVRGGEPVWISVSTRPLNLAGGLPCAVVASSRDVTARREMRAEVRARERSLAEAEQRFRSIFSMAPIGMGIVRNGYVVQANQAWADIMGRSAEELEGQKVDAFTYPGDPATTEAAVSLEGGRTSYRVDKRYVHAEGHPVWVQLDLSAVRDGDGAIQYVIVQVQDIADRRRHEEQLEHIANHDALTGLLNRRGFQQALEDHVRHAGRYGADGAMLMLDLDDFKLVNDTLGHKAGDELIVKAAGLLAGRLRESDIVARIGGDEFAILLPHGDRDAATTLATALLTSLREWRPEADAEESTTPGGIMASIGIAMCVAGATADDLLVNADLAMYDAKEGGRDRWALYAVGDGGEEPRMKARQSLLGRLRRAIDQRTFELFAQPIVDLRGESTPMYEVLLRLRSDSGELILPDAFLSIAERVDLVQEIDRLVIDQTIGAMQDADFPVSLAVNLAGKSIGDPDLPATIERRLKQTGVPPAALVIEVTETAAVSQIEPARTLAIELQRVGCRLAIDDFGAGFGSLTYLKHLPFDFLKIDGELVAGAAHSRADAVIVEAVRHIAHGLGRAVIGKGCSEASSVEFLRRRGVDFAQGYHLGRPAPLEDVLRRGRGESG